MELLHVDTIDQARAKLVAHTGWLALRQERVPLDQAAGQVLAADVFCGSDIPGFDRSTVDGYAVVARDTAGAGESMPVVLSLAGSVEMGAACEVAIASGQCVAVPTGGMLPPGADAVVMVEHTEPFARGVAVYDAVAPGAGMVHGNDDACAGDLLLRRGTRLRAAEIGVLAAAGVAEAEVFALPRMAIISTGDELVAPVMSPKPGQVRDVNTSALAAQARAAGFAVGEARVCVDDESLLEQAVAEAMAAHDFVVVSGGSSQGEKDATARIIGRLASSGVITHGLAIKPGKPTILGADEMSKTVLVGLPGHPISAMMVFEVMLSWFVRTLMGAAEPLPLPAVLAHNVPASPGKETLVLVTLALDKESTCLVATPVWAQSGLITRLAGADAYIRIGHDCEGLAAGCSVFAYPL